MTADGQENPDQPGRRKFVRDAIWLSLGRIVNLAVGAVAMLIYGIVFAKTQIAVFSLFEMVVGLFMAFGVTWSSVGLTRFGKEELSEHDSLNYTSSTRLHLVLPVLLFATFSILAFQGQILNYIGGSSPAIIYYLIGQLVLMAAHDHLNNLFTAREKHSANALFFVAQSIGRFLVLVAFYLEWVQPSVLRLIMATVWLDAILLVVRFPTCAKPYCIPLVKVRRQDVKRFLRYAAPQLYGFAGIYLINWIDVYFIRKHGTMEGLGAYQFMYGIFLKIATLAMLVNGLLFPRIMAWKLTRPDAIAKFTQRVPPLAFVAAIVASAVLLIVFPLVFDFVFGDKYQMAYSSFVLLVCCIPFRLVTFLFVPVLNSFDRVKTIQWANILSAACNVGLDYYLVPAYGIIGAAGATLVANVVVAVLLMHAVSQQFKVHVGMLWGITLAVLAYAAWFFVSNI